MSENSTLSIRNQVVASLIAAVILAIGSFILGWWGVIWGWVVLAFTTTGSILSITYSVPLWAIIPLVAVVIFAGLIILAHISSHNSTDTPSLPFLQYIEDSIHDVNWRWDWCLRGGKYDVNNLQAYCPTCDGQLIFHDTTRFGKCSCELICEHCQHSVKTAFDEGDFDYAQGQISREIKRRARKEEFPA